jgi:hypothetical protein
MQVDKLDKVSRELLAYSLLTDQFSIYAGADHGDNPDFVSKEGNFGIEITELPSETDTDIKRQILEDTIAKGCEKIFSDAGHSFGTFVNICFHRNLVLNRNQIDSLAQTLVATVLRDSSVKLAEGRMKDLEIIENLPSGVEWISYDIMSKPEDSLWNVSRQKDGQELTSHDLDNVIKKKENKLEEYRKAAGRIILVIIEGVGPRSWFLTESSDWIISPTGFDEVYLMRLMTSNVIRLK